MSILTKYTASEIMGDLTLSIELVNQLFERTKKPWCIYKKPKREGFTVARLDHVWMEHPFDQRWILYRRERDVEATV
jgi:hypothetical protein